MRKILLSLIAITTICTNAWGWTCGNTTITISGSSYVVTPIADTDGAMGDLAAAPTSNWGANDYKNSSSYTSIIFEEGVTHIGANTFNGFSYLTSISIPSTLASIGDKAFANCTNISAIHAPDPNVWASVELDIASGRFSHPFFARYNKSSSNKGQFYFYGKDTPATEIVFTAGLTEIKKYTFSYSTGITYVHIPGTVTSIGDYALDCNIDRIFINKAEAPSTGTTAISWKTGSETYLFLRDDATNSYNATPWLNATESATTGATKLCYISDYSGLVINCSWKSGRKLYKTSGTIGAINWTLAENGTLTLNGTGSMPSTYNTTYNDKDVLPWFRLRQLVNKVVIKGGITDIGNALDKCWAIKEVSIEQNTIPSGTYGIYVNYKSASDTVKVYLKANASSISTAKSSSPWNNAKIRFGLNEAAQFSDGDETTLLSALKTLNLPFTLQLGRTLIVDGDQYNTFCSPIDLTKAQLNDADIRELESSSLDGEDLTLTFSEPREGIEAGKPYLVRPTTETLSNPTFADITPSSLVSIATNTETDFVDFIGVLAPTLLTEGNKNTLFLGAGNELFWPEADGNIGGMRAYFSVKGAAQKNGIRARIVMNKEVATGIEDVRSESAGAVRSEKILRNGQIIIIRDGKEYNVMGIMMK